MSAVSYPNTLFQPTTQASREQFDARIYILGTRLERFLRSQLWHLCVNPDDLEDAIQGALIRLWAEYQKQPWLMDVGDGWWLHFAFRGAQNTLRAMVCQRGLKTAQGIRRLEYTASSYESEQIDQDGLELLEAKHFRRHRSAVRSESDQADRRLDTERLVAAALKQLTIYQRETVMLLIPLIAEGYPICEAARKAGLGKNRAQRTWEVFRQVCEALAGKKREPLKGKGAPASAGELDHICELAAQGLSCAVIATQLWRGEDFVKQHFEKATGYRRGANNQRNPITPERVEQMKALRLQGMSMSVIAKTVGCSTGSIHYWLHQ